MRYQHAIQAGTIRESQRKTKGKDVPRTLRAELSKPTVEDASETGYEMWAREIISNAKDNAARLEVLKFLEGASPPDKGMLEEDLPIPEACDEYGNPVEP